MSHCNPFRRNRKAPTAPTANEASILQSISILTGKVTAMSEQIANFVAKVDQLLAKDAAVVGENTQLKAQLVDAQNQLAALQAQISAGALSADDQNAIAAEQAKIDAALSA